MLVIKRIYISLYAAITSCYINSAKIYFFTDTL